MITLPRYLWCTCGGGLFLIFFIFYFFLGCLVAALGRGLFCFLKWLRSTFGGGLFHYRLHSFGKSPRKQFCLTMIILIIIMLSIEVQAQNIKYQPFRNNVTALHDTVINGTKFKTEVADASTSFKILKMKKADALGTLYASLQTVIKTNDIKNVIELRNQVKYIN